MEALFEVKYPIWIQSKSISEMILIHWLLMKYQRFLKEIFFHFLNKFHYISISFSFLWKTNLIENQNKCSNSILAFHQIDFDWGVRIILFGVAKNSYPICKVNMVF